MELIISKLNSPISRNFKRNFNITDDKLILDFVNRRHIPMYIANLAAENGHIGLVKYLENKGLKVNQDGINLAVNNGRLEMVKYLESEAQEGVGCLKVYHFGINLAAGSGNIEMVKYLENKGLEVSQSGINEVVKNGHLEMVKYIESERSENDGGVGGLEIYQRSINVAAEKVTWKW